MNQRSISFIVLISTMSVLLGILCFSQERLKTTDLDEIKEITGKSKQLIASGVVKEIPVQPTPKKLIKIDEWVFWMNNISDHWRTVLFMKEGLKGGIPPANLESLKPVADEYGVANFTLLKIYTVRQDGDPSKKYIVHAHRNEFGIVTHNNSDKLVSYLDLEKLGIKLKPALFFSDGTDEGGSFLKILVVDEDNVSKLHRGDFKYVIVKFYPVSMKVSSSGTINTPSKGLYPWRGKRRE